MIDEYKASRYEHISTKSLEDLPRTFEAAVGNATTRHLRKR
jgi:hypothetical protein